MVVVCKFSFFVLAVWMLTDVAGQQLDPEGLDPNRFYKDIRRKELTEVPLDGSVPISGLYTRVSPKDKWPGGILHWEYDPNSTFTTAEKDLITESLGQLTRRTCIQILPRTNQTAYVNVKNNATDGCWSLLGYLNRKQDLNLGVGCLWTKTIIHEFMHALGFEHEQTRYDRDMYMKVVWQNIETANAYNFNKQPRTLSFPKYNLDFRSVMMYRLTAFSLNPNTLPAMTVVKNPENVPEIEIGQSVNMTDSDVARIKSAYKCPASLKFKSIGALDMKSGYENFF